MANIGKVTVGPTGQQTSIRIRQATQTTIANPNIEPDVNVSLSELTDVSTANVQNGYTIVYNSVTQKYEASPISGVAITIDNVFGGIF